jgi:mono/diheme cytochrome c family protein
MKINALCMLAAAWSLSALLSADVNPDALKLFQGKCAKCHGAQGDGTGKTGRLLDPKPTDFTSAKWQAGMKDEDIVEAITNGGRSAKLKISKKMADYGSKLSKDQIQALVTVVRSFKKADAK